MQIFNFDEKYDDEEKEQEREAEREWKLGEEEYK